jgi:serine/threonine protein kinase
MPDCALLQHLLLLYDSTVVYACIHALGLKYFRTTSFLSLLEDSKIDLWSVGMLVLFCLNAETPFNGADVSQYSSDREIEVTAQVTTGGETILVMYRRTVLHIISLRLITHVCDTTDILVQYLDSAVHTIRIKKEMLYN